MEWLEASQGQALENNQRSLTLVVIRMSLSLLYGQLGHNIAQPCTGPPIESAECRISWPIWELKWYTDGLSATMLNDVDLKWKKQSFNFN